MELEPFDIERAKSGDKVVTRDGREVNILTFLRKHKTHNIVALVQSDTFSNPSDIICAYDKDGKVYQNYHTINDLFHPAKEMWVIVFRNNTTRDYLYTGSVHSTREIAASIGIETPTIYVGTYKLVKE
jgi:hypothetical protein